MSKRSLQKLVLLLSLIIISNTMHSQVTIGSNKKSIEGALLMLEDDEIYSNGANASKGIGLPRVGLTSYSNLFPMFKADGTEYKKGTTTYIKAAQDAIHEGLMVYNMNEDVCASKRIYKGLHVWNGSEWQFLGQKEKPSVDVFYYTDTRPQLLGNQSYAYRNFGTKAGDWMLENMRYVPNDGSPVELTEDLGTSNADGKFYAYPNQTSVGTVPDSWSLAQGLLYTYSAATLGAQDGLGNVQSVQDITATIGVDEVENSPKWPIEGVCPPGWHVPSDREWNDLEEAIYNKASDYSTYTVADVWNPAVWNPEWNIITGIQTSSTGSGGLAFAMQSFCKVTDSPHGATGGKSLSTIQGGFNALLSGFAMTGSTLSYGDYALLWSSSGYGPQSAKNRSMRRGNAQMIRSTSNRSVLYSVRCKSN